MSSDEKKSDHDLLIEIGTKVNLFHDAFFRHLKEDEAEFTIIRKSLSAVHRRVDWLMVSGVLAIIVLTISIWFDK